MCSQQPQRNPPCKAPFWAVSVLLTFAVACQLTSADEVTRPPATGHGSGGSSGRDLGPADGPNRDSLGVEIGRRDVPDSTDAALASVRNDAAIDRASPDGRLQIDGNTWPLDSRSDDEVEKSCGEDDSPCDAAAAAPDPLIPSR